MSVHTSVKQRGVYFITFTCFSWLPLIVGNGKRFIGYDIVKTLAEKEETVLLNQMKEAVRTKDRERNKKHELWQGTFDVKECRTEKFILQKLICVHNNPCSGKWNLCDKPYEYAHSSAKFYDGDKAGYKVKDYLDVPAELKYGIE